VPRVLGGGLLVGGVRAWLCGRGGFSVVSAGFRIWNLEWSGSSQTKRVIERQFAFFSLFVKRRSSLPGISDGATQVGRELFISIGPKDRNWPRIQLCLGCPQWFDEFFHSKPIIYLLLKIHKTKI
jgi:hypothetical protein